MRSYSLETVAAIIGYVVLEEKLNLLDIVFDSLSY
jgi:hypothetical protein